jgi:hypothetical protein
MVTANGVSSCKETEVTATASSEGESSDTPLALENCVLDQGQVTLTWKSIPGRSYRVEYTTSMNAPTWQPVTGDVQALGTRSEKTDVIGRHRQRFYRVIMLE